MKKVLFLFVLAAVCAGAWMSWRAFRPKPQFASQTPLTATGATNLATSAATAPASAAAAPAITNTPASSQPQPAGPRPATREFDLSVNPYASALREPGKSKRAWDAEYLQTFRQSKSGDPVKFELTGGLMAEGTLKIIQFANGMVSYVSGELTAPEAGKFFLLTPPAGGRAGSAVGVVEFWGSKTAYRIEPTGLDGAPELWQRRLDEVLCLTMPKPEQEDGLTNETANIPPLRPDQVPDYIPSYNSNVVSLQSFPGSPAVILLDFFGGYTPTWSGAAYPKPNVSVATIKDLWKRVAEDYMPYKINVTTDWRVYQAANVSGRQRCVFTPSTPAMPAGAAGVAYIGSWNWGSDTVCWSIYTSGKAGGEVGSHEVGHTLGLGHQGTSTSGYSTGHNGPGTTGWSPIMGAGYYQPVTTWAKGEYQDANNTQDELATMLTYNGVQYRTDDTGDSLATSRYLEIYSNFTASAEGVIERSADTDAFQFTTTGGSVNLTVSPVGDWADLAVTATLFDSLDTLIASNAPQSALTATISAVVPAGTYTFRVTGAGRNNPLTDGFSSYGSLGYYSVSGSVAGARLPTRLSIAENSTNGTVVGSVPATNPDGDPLAYTIDSGNISNTFVIDNNGVLTVVNASALNYEALAQFSSFPVQYELFMDIVNTLNPSLTELNRRVVVQVLDVNETPVITGFTNVLMAHTLPGTVAGAVNASDPDFYSVLSLTILSGNSNGMFALDSGTGSLSVMGDLNPAVQNAYVLQVRITDNGAPALMATGYVQITITTNNSPFQPGVVNYAAYDGIGGGNLVSALTGNPRYPRDPTWQRPRTSFEADTDRADNFGAVMRGYLVAPMTGTYTFWIASDDNSELWFSTTTNPASATLIASVSGDGNYTAARQWTKFASQQSAPRSLTAGQAYYVEARHKEGGGGDNLAVAWKGPATANQTNVISGLYLAPYFMNFVPHAAGFSAAVRRDSFGGKRVGRVNITDVNSNDTHTASITAGNSAGLFGVDNAGWVFVANETALAASVVTNFSLTVQVTDSGAPPQNAATVVNLTLVEPGVIATTQTQRELFYNIAGTAVTDLTGNPRYPTRPDALTALSSLASPVNIAENFGSRIRALVVPPVGGDYRFFIASDDSSQLKFSSTTNPGSAAIIASVSGSTAQNEWTRFPSQTSALIPGLVAGQSYYLEAIQKEGGGGDHVSVSWLVPGSGATNIIPGTSLLPVDINYSPQVSGVLGVSRGAANGSFVGMIPALDSAVDTLTFKLVAGNTNNTFSLDPNGALSVADNSLIASGSVASFGLTIAAQDSGYGGLYPLRTTTGTVSVIVLPPGSYVEAVATNGPEAYWRLGELSGATAYDLVGGHHGFYTSATLNQSGAIVGDTDRCARFNGTSSWVGTGQSLANNLAAFTLEGWFRLAVSPAKMGFWGQNDAIEFGLVDSANLQIFTAGGGTVNATYTGGVNLWHHVAAIGDGTDLRIYVDGNLVATGGSPTANYGGSSFPFNIGGGGIWDSTGNWFNGWIDEVAFYDKALSAAEIRHHYLLGLAKPTITLTSPINNSSYMAPATISLGASVNPNGHTITNVQFFNDTTLLNVDSTPLYSFDWTGVEAGTATVKAVAVYDTGSVTSSVANVTIVSPQPAIQPGAAVSGGNFGFQFTGAVGQHYRVEFSPIVSDPGPWQVLTDITALASSPFAISDPATNNQRFYRVILVP